ncbi:hypothetical protein [Candidatus Ruthturnera calyptogenae]|uniref:hypothetical protein n=1 Tax=Candidatus Ruthturnera calyptogenae TaxID=386487 RepID=UPI00031058D5|nr:hypothetical protein [Candidatus Ruthturnera calyptogenae]
MGKLLSDSEFNILTGASSGIIQDTFDRKLSSIELNIKSSLYLNECLLFEHFLPAKLL